MIDDLKHYQYVHRHFWFVGYMSQHGWKCKMLESVAISVYMD